jgi:hypothetical protein
MCRLGCGNALPMVQLAMNLHCAPQKLRITQKTGFAEQKSSHGRQLRKRPVKDALTPKLMGLPQVY